MFVGEKNRRTVPRIMNGCFTVWLFMVFVGASSGWAGSIDTTFLEQPWHRQWVREYEVGRYLVKWRQKASRRDGIFAGASFLAPTRPEKTWALATDYTDLGTMTPGVSAVRFLENTPSRQVIEVDVKVLWKALTLIFEIEHDPPEAVRFRLANRQLGEYRGVCLMRPHGEQTAIELITWLKPAVQVPSGLILWAERVVLLKGIRGFLETCQQAQSGGT